MTEPDESAASPRIPEAVRQRAEARRAAGAASDQSAPASPAPKRAETGPSPGRILAAAGSVSLGIGLVGVMAATGQGSTTIEVNPTPVVVQPATVVVEVTDPASPDAEPVRTITVVEAATPAATAVSDAAPVAKSEGS